MTNRACRVAVVIPCFNQAHFLPDAIDSALRQSTPPDEVIVIDDGSDDDVGQATARFPGVQVICQRNRGLAAARNRGLAAAKSDKIIFLDADDRLLPGAICAGLACFARKPDSAFVYGGYRLVQGSREQERFRAVDSRCDLLRCNWIAMIGAVMFDRRKLAVVGGFDETLGMLEDWDVYLRLTRDFPFAAHDSIVACYHWHDRNMSRDRRRLLHWVEVVRAKEKGRGLGPDELRAWQDGARAWASAYPGRSVRLARRLRALLVAGGGRRGGRAEMPR